MNVEVLKEQACAGPVFIEFCGGRLAIASSVCPDKSSPNEDALAYIELAPNHGVIVVADGMGGHLAGARAAGEIVDQIAAACNQDTDGSSVRSLLVDAMDAANQTICSWGFDSGTTVIVGELLDNQLRMIHAGDSCGLVCSNRGRIKYFSVAHAPVAMAVEIGVLDQPEAMLHEERNVVNNYVGYPEMRVEVGPPIDLAARDTVVMATDGLFDNLTVDEIVQLVRAGSLETQFEKLIANTTQRMNTNSLTAKPDDLTVACFRRQRERKDSKKKS